MQYDDFAPGISLRLMCAEKSLGNRTLREDWSALVGIKFFREILHDGIVAQRGSARTTGLLPAVCRLTFLFYLWRQIWRTVIVYAGNLSSKRKATPVGWRIVIVRVAGGIPHLRLVVLLI